MDHVQKLKDLAVRLEAAHDKKVEEFEKQYQDIDPFDIVDSNGRPILLDSLVAMVHAWSVIAQLEPIPRGGAEREKGRVSSDAE